MTKKMAIEEKTYNSSHLCFAEYAYRYKAELCNNLIREVAGRRYGILYDLEYGYLDLITNYFVNDDNIIGKPSNFKVKGVNLTNGQIVNIFKNVERDKNYIASEHLIDVNGWGIPVSEVSFKASEYLCGFAKAYPVMRIIPAEKTKKSFVKTIGTMFKKK